MLGTKRSGSSSKSHEPIGTTITTDNGQQVTASQLISQLGEAATKRLHRMNQRLRLLEQQMETLQTEVGKTSSDSYE